MKIEFIVAAILTLLGVSVTVSAQTNVVMSNGVFYSCGGAFLDSGGQGGPGYQNDEYFTCTICPENEGDVVTVDFITFDLDQTGNENTWDYIAIYDGDNTGAPSLGYYTGDQLQGLFVTATPQNTSGCLTFVFDSNSVGTGNFGGTISCDTPCDRPIADATYDAPLNHRICVGDVINFDGSASSAADGFEIVEWLWDFADGTTDDSGAIVSHFWNEPGEYVVELFLMDDNGCASTNRISLQLLVATYPSWSPFANDTTLCIGEDLCLEAFPDDYEVTWSGPDLSYENPTNVELLDNVGECFPSEIEVTGFAPGQTLENVNDLLGIDVSIEHSFLFDLVISITCPTGESVVLHQQMSQPDGPNVGANGTDLGIPDTEFWDYTWSADAPNGTWSQVATNLGDVLPEDTYSTLEPLDQLVGCDLNGVWTLEICDLWGGDNGELSGWGLNFNPAIIPDVTEFTPDIGALSDSSFWSFDPVGLDIFNQSADGNSVCLMPQEEGVWPFTYTVINNHGCQTDSTITITANLAAQADAGDDVVYCGPGTTLSGGLEGIPTPLCSADAGDYSYCYTNGGIQSFTYCPDDPGDGTTYMDVTFSAGSVEDFFDEFWVYDGDDINAPLIAGPIYGDLSGLSFVATNASGCITIAVTPDGSIDCSGGWEIEWEYTVGCNLGGPQYEFSWTPADGLSDPTIPNPELSDVQAEMSYTLTTFPLGHPDCASSDEVVVTPSFIFEVDFIQPLCFEPSGEVNVYVDGGSGEGPWDVILYLGGDVVGAESTNGGDVLFEGLEPSEYLVTIGNASCTFEEEINMTTPPVISLTASNDTTICQNGMATLSVVPSAEIESLQWEWSNGATTQSIEVMPPVETIYQVFGTFGEGCYTDTVQVAVSLYDPIQIDITAGDTICLGDSIFIGVDAVSGGLAPYTHTWTWDGGGEIISEGSYVFPEYTANWCCTTTDACETSPVTECINIAISDPIDPTFSVDTLGGCVPTMVMFQGNADNPEHIAEGIWDFGDGGISAQSHSANHVYDTQGTYSVTYTIVSNEGCFFEHTEEDLLTFFNWPIAGFNMEPQTAVLPNTLIQFHNYTLGADQFTWLMNETDTLFDEAPSYHFPPMAGTYPVTLFVENDWGCQDSLSRIVFVVDEFVMYIPNAFTPDQDGVNDVFRFEGIDVDVNDFELQIFDRWGEIVFKTNDFEEGWDGSYQNGEYYVSDGVYIYRVVTRSITTQERKEIVGHVLILR